MSPFLEDGYCADAECRCHTTSEHRVYTPFPVGYGPPYCCSRCARVEIVPAEAEPCYYCGLPVFGQSGPINAQQWAPMHVVCPAVRT